MMTDLPSAGLLHSDTHGSLLAYRSPWLFAVRCVLLRLPVPRHSPCALLLFSLLLNCSLYLACLATMLPSASRLPRFPCSSPIPLPKCFLSTRYLSRAAPLLYHISSYLVNYLISSSPFIIVYKKFWGSLYEQFTTISILSLLSYLYFERNLSLINIVLFLCIALNKYLLFLFHIFGHLEKL